MRLRERGAGWASMEKAMGSHSIGTIAFAQGFLEDYIENEASEIEILETDSDGTMLHKERENEHRLQVRNMWIVVSRGLDQLMKENASLKNKLSLIDIARNTET
jgi:hypothetical protein